MITRKRKTKSFQVFWILLAWTFTHGFFSFAEETRSVGSLVEELDRQTLLNDVTDWLATLGKSDREKAAIIRKRKEERRQWRFQRMREEKRLEIQRRNELLWESNRDLKSKLKIH